MTQPAYGKTYPFDGSQEAGDAEWRHLAAAFGDGVVNDVDGTAFKMAASASSRVVTVTLGFCRVQGIIFEPVDATLDVTLDDLTAGHLRCDRIVARYDPTGKSISVIPIIGSDVTTGTPAVPALTRAPGGTWDLPLAHFAGGNGAASTLVKTDDRSWIGADGVVANAAALDPDAPIGTTMLALDTGALWRAVLVGTTPTWVDQDTPTWVDFPLAGTAGTLSAFDTAPLYSKVRQKVKLRGTVQRTTGNLLDTTSTVNAIIGTLPVGCRPASIRRFQVPCFGGGIALSNRLAVAANGQVSVYADGLSMKAVCIDSVEFYAEN